MIIEKNLHGVKRKTNYIFVWFCMAVGIFSIVFTKLYMSSLSGAVDIFDNASLNIREAYVNTAREAPFFVIYGKYLLLLSFLVILYDKLYKISKISNLMILILGMLVVYNSTLTFARTDLLLSVLSIFFVYLSYVQSLSLKENESYLKIAQLYRKSRKNLIILFVIILIVFVSLTSIRSVEQSSFLNPQNQIMQYVGKPISAFDQWVVDKPFMSADWAVFEPLSKFLTLIGVKLDIDQLWLNEVNLTYIHT